MESAFEEIFLSAEMSVFPILCAAVKLSAAYSCRRDMQPAASPNISDIGANNSEKPTMPRWNDRVVPPNARLIAGFSKKIDSTQSINPVFTSEMVIV